MDLDRLFTEQEAGHVEIVNHHVTEQATGTLDIGDWRRPWIA